MPKHMHREINKLLDQMLGLADTVQLRLIKAVDAVIKRDLVAADEVIKGDEEINRLEVDLEEECLKFLALYQPVATDLRLIVAVLKINNDLERIGDIASHIAQRGIFIARHGVGIEIPIDIAGLASKVENMLALCIRALIQKDSQLARDVCHIDQEIDQIHTEAYSIVSAEISSNPTRVEFYIQVLSLSRYLERIADLATNIAEDVIYLVEGTIMRHQKI